MNLLKEQRTLWETQNHQLWLASLQNAKKGQEQSIRSKIDAAQATANRRLLAALREALPPSIKVLLGTPLEESVGRARNIVEWWDQKLANMDKNSRAYAFMEAGKRASLERNRIN